jgi:hypothetical protein
MKLLRLEIPHHQLTHARLRDPTLRAATFRREYEVSVMTHDGSHRTYRRLRPDTLPDLRPDEADEVHRLVEKWK